MITPSPPRPPRWLLPALALLMAVALGWVLNDVLGQPTTGDQSLPVSETKEPTTVVVTRVVEAPTSAPVQPTTVPTAPLLPPTHPQPATVTVTAAPAISDYSGHIVAAGETLEQIAANRGSTPELIAAYNRLSRAPQPGRGLIVPRLAGESAVPAGDPIMVTRGAAERPWVALTLDAGAGSEPTARMLDALRERGVRVTFFLTGAWITANPALTRRIVAEGHELANHTYHHPDLTTLDDEDIRRELAETEAALQAVAPEATLRPFFRPPYGAYDERVQRVVQQAGYLPVY